MIILIAGSTHTGKTLLAQKLLEKYKFPYLSIDHIKMGLIRGGICKFNAESSDKELTPYLWNIVKEIIKTAIENGQNLIIEGCYIPFDYKEYFSDKYLSNIKYLCLIFSKSYILNNFDKITENQNVIEKRTDDNYCTKELMIRENTENLKLCKENSCRYVLIDNEYNIEFQLVL
ncbi:MAG: zeta toxin family protein [Clostridia bacterium]|nr:zeta toxin family protein [Clostridia bacterium]